ncbi:protein SDA1 homolog [Strongylocentrotus purpuratus]|uniref:Protein SDA1 n=1 Tax=Strongylocentrotus purpuratus TaxID=7668 RepID=A0A7M7NM92_STRPU|nr:protein SDA1 homolog [Strongylocentrotus purpuratus]|eukprot:XP_790502.3 PREDICTED: protein SDA1 homolog [Strongylocentrotus purpuratus]
MSEKNRNKLPNNLPQLQNVIKRDPESYTEEFLQQYRHYQSNVQVFQLKPSQYSKSLEELTMFLSQVAHCYPEHLSDYPQQLKDLLQTYSTVLDPNMRMTLCKGLILLRNRGLVSPTSLLGLFFELFRCQDKVLRKMLFDHIVNDIKRTNAKHKDNKLNTTLQNFMYTMLTDNSSVAAKMSLDVMIELYQKNIWNDTKTVNVIVTACFSKVTKILVTGLKFFLGSDEEGDDDDDSDSESEDEGTVAKHILIGKKVNKTSKKRQKKTKKALTVLRKHKKKRKRKEAFNFSALHLVHDPQDFAERLFKQLEKTTERFEVKLMMINLVSRLVGIHQLVLFNFYPFLQRFIQPSQKEVTKILLYTAQATHELVPPDIIESVLRTLVNNFVTERNSNEVMAVGLNAVREVCARCPLAMGPDLLQDLTQYKNYRSKSVMAASRSLIHLFRKTNPELLHRKDKGKPTEQSTEAKAKEFGELVAPDFIPGAEVLGEEKEEDQDEDKDGWETASNDSHDSEDSWHNVVHSSDDEGDAKEGAENPATNLTMEEKVTRATAISQTRILTQEDFQAIRTEQVRKELANAPKAKAGRKRKNVEISSDKNQGGELLSLNQIESIHYKPKHDRETRMATLMAGREGREKFGSKRQKMNPHASTTNKQKRKNKPFMMLKQKFDIKSKFKRSFREKQTALRDSLLKKSKKGKY